MIKDLGELQKILKLCRKQGVTEIKLGDVSISFGPLPKKAQDAADDLDEPETDELTPEQLIYFSAGGVEPP